MNAMNNDQFDKLSELIDSDGGPGAQGARLVLVEGVKAKEAAEVVGVTFQSVYKSVRRFKKAFELSKAVHQ